ncbi:hypothetical protein [Haloplanus salinus]|nr:hypothetical protein [Haloplanus salinus]
MRKMTNYQSVTNSTLKNLYPTDYWSSRYHAALRISRNHESGRRAR